MGNFLRWAWDSLVNYVHEPLPSITEIFWRFVTAVMIMAASFVVAVLGIGFWWLVDHLIDRFLYISDLVLLLVLVPSMLTMAFGGFVALHSRKFNEWIWAMLTSKTIWFVMAGGFAVACFA
jgi:hypothetical protein